MATVAERSTTEATPKTIKLAQPRLSLAAKAAAALPALDERTAQFFPEAAALIAMANGKPIRVIDHSAHRSEGGCNVGSMWTWHTQAGGHIGTTEPFPNLVAENLEVYTAKASSTHAFVGKQFIESEYPGKKLDGEEFTCTLSERAQYIKTLPYGRRLFYYLRKDPGATR